MKFLCITVLLLTGAIPLWACNHCGGASTGNAMGMLPISSRNFAGTMCLYSQQSVFEDDRLISRFTGVLSSTFVSINLIDNVSLQVTVPLACNNLHVFSNDVETHVQEVFLGDIQLIARYTLPLGIDSIKQSSKTLSVFLGAELPSGVYNGNYKQDDMPVTFYPGSQSIDPIAGLQYQFNQGKYTLGGNALYRYSTFNKDQFKAGFQLNTSIFASRKFGAWSPFCGLGVDIKGNDWKYTFEQEGSNFTAGYAMAGLEWSGRNVLVGTRNHINLYSQFGETDTKSPGMVSAYFSYFFN